MIFPDCSCRFFLHLLESKSSFSKIPNLNIKSAMKLTGPFNQLRSFLPSKVGASGYRFLCIFMAALLFCGMNSQVMAASVVPGANNDFNNNAPASGDKFNSESFLKASNPNADDNQHWTWGEEIGAGILGAALLGGAVVGGYKCYQGRQERIAEAGRNEVLRSSTDSFGDGSPDSEAAGANSEGLAVRGSGVSTAREKTITVATGGDDVDHLQPGADATPGWRQKAADSLAWMGRGAWRLGQGAYDLMTLKSCRSAASAEKLVAEKSLMEYLTEVRTAQLKTERAAKKANRSWPQFAWDLLTLNADVLPSDETAMQKKDKEMAAFGKKPNTQLTVSQLGEQYSSPLDAKDKRAVAIEALNTQSSCDDMYAVLDPAVVPAFNKLIGNEDTRKLQEDTRKLQEDDSENFDKKRKLLYFVAKNPAINPGHIEAMKETFLSEPGSNQNEKSRAALLEKINEAVEALWQENNEV